MHVPATGMYPQSLSRTTAMSRHSGAALEHLHARFMRTALQAATGLGTAGRTVQMARHLISSQGIGSLYRGLTPAVLGAGPAHALYYAVYEQTKTSLGARQPGQSPATVAAAGTTSDAAVLFHRVLLQAHS